MPITIPQIDDRSYSQILNEARARIRVHNPEWTNFNDSDPGITLLQLFAFMTENLLYRSNLIPERNRMKFLKLLGIGMRPASSAVGVVSFADERGPMSTATLPAGFPLLAGKVGFATQNALDVLPVEGHVFYRRKLSDAEQAQAGKSYTQLFGTFQDGGTSLDFYETVPVNPPASAAAIQAISLSDATTVDRSLWIALAMRPRELATASAVSAEIAGKTLTLGLMPAVDDTERVLSPGGSGLSATPARLIYEISSGEFAADGKTPLYTRLDARADDDPLQNLTLVQLTLPEQIGVWNDLDPLEDGVGDLPPSIEDNKLAERVLAWIRLRLPDDSAGNRSADSQTSPSQKASFSWVGINAARVTQRMDVVGEPLGTGSGEPDQAYTLVNKPVLPGSVRLTVGNQLWSRTDDLLAAPPEVPVADPTLPPRPGSSKPPADPRVFVVDRESGEIRFGDGLRGARPPLGASIVASYAWGGGDAGNVGIGSIKTSPVLPAGFTVSNPLPTWGGAEGETVSEAERNIPKFLRHSDRAVTAEDFKDIVRRAPGVDVGRVDVLPIYHPTLGSPAPGVVTLMVVPNDPTNPQAPSPSLLFLNAICAWLDPRRLITTEVHVRGPQYVPISVSAGIDVVPGKDIAPVREAVQQAIRLFLSPLAGGQDEQGWPLQKTVEDREVWARAARVDGVAKVRDVFLYDANTVRQATIEIRGLQLPQLVRVAVAMGDPDDLTTAVSGLPSPRKRLAVPVLPQEC